jgi:hypothetical protein
LIGGAHCRSFLHYVSLSSISTNDLHSKGYKRNGTILAILTILLSNCVYICAL